MLLSEKILQFDSEAIKSPGTSACEIQAAKKQWYQILVSASDSHLKTIIYRDTETGYNLLNENIKLNVPCSLPGKLLSFLFHRFRYFNGSSDKGITIISSGPINNSENLEAIILELAHLNNLNPKFLDWIENSNSFIRHQKV